MFAAAVWSLSAGPAAADQWNERTILKFSEPIMIPGETLPAGSYVFQLADSAASRHVVEVKSEDGSRTFATLQAVPLKRPDSKGDTVLKFNPTEPGAPPALKAWFYPGSLYGHEFVYPVTEARKIAERTKTIVLSSDVSGTDLEKGTLRVYDASGKEGTWRADAETMREWDAWQRQRRTNAASDTPAGMSGRTDASSRSPSTAPMMESDAKGMRVTIDALEDNAAKYTGKTVTVDAEVEDVFGPRLFSIDEPAWGDVEGEILVSVPEHAAALVRENDRITVTGEIKKFSAAGLERERTWLEADLDDGELAATPVLHASRIVGGDNDVAMLIDLRKPRKSGAESGTSTSAVGTAGKTGSTGAPVTDIGSLATTRTSDLVGRDVDLTKVPIARVTKEGGFWLQRAGGPAVFVKPAHSVQVTVKEGDTIGLDGVVLEMPRGMRDRLGAPDQANTRIYVYATKIEKIDKR
jgi:hypothetical protein